MNEFEELTGSIKLGSWNFNIISLSDMNLYSDYIKLTEYPANLWSSNFALLWAISQSPYRKVLWNIVDDMLVTFGYMKSGFLYLICLPFGKGDCEKVVRITQVCLNYCSEWNKKYSPGAVVKVVNNLQLDFLRKSSEFDKNFKVTGLIGMEKHFSITKLLSLAGKEFEALRRKLNKFKRLCPEVIIREYKHTDYEEVMKLNDIWTKTFGQKYPYIFDDIYFRNMIKHYKELEHLVLVVESNKKLIGVVSGGELPTGESWWCISKFSDEYEGISEFLIIELAKEIHRRNPKIELMNAASDLGPGGLRFYKERFRPVLNLRRFLIELR